MFREVMGSVAQKCSLSHARVMLISSNFITELNIHYLSFIFTIHDDFDSDDASSM